VSFNKVLICGYEELRESAKEGITRFVTMSNIMRITVLASLVSNTRSTKYAIYSIETVQVRLVYLGHWSNDTTVDLPARKVFKFRNKPIIYGFANYVITV